MLWSQTSTSSRQNLSSGAVRGGKSSFLEEEKVYIFVVIERQASNTLRIFNDWIITWKQIRQQRRSTLTFSRGDIKHYSLHCQVDGLSFLEGKPSIHPQYLSTGKKQFVLAVKSTSSQDTNSLLFTHYITIQVPSLDISCLCLKLALIFFEDSTISNERIFLI